MNGADLKSSDALERSLKLEMLYRGLQPVRGELAFVHKGATVDVAIDHSVYRGALVSVQARGRTVRAFRAQSGTYDWDAIASAIIDTAEGRVAQDRMADGRVAHGSDSANEKLAADLRAMLGPNAAHLTIEPSPATPGRVRVRLREVELDALAVVQLLAAVSGALPHAPVAAALPHH
jgi:hypothetical protein